MAFDRPTQSVYSSMFLRFFLLPAIIFTSFFFALMPRAFAASLALEQAGGSFIVGSTFNVTVLLDSENEAVNALEVGLKFPPDKLQVVSPSTGQSIIALWTDQPTFSNTLGTVSLQGLIPNGLTTSRGVVTTLVFRVKSPGAAYVTFSGNTKVLRHDGLGTNVLSGSSGGVYTLILPPPSGPIVASETHPDPTSVYRTNTVLLSWSPEDPDVEGYSYMLSATPIDIPDDIAEGSDTSTVYPNVPDGIRYFHIKALRKGHWGGTSHFSVNIDATPPAQFPVELVLGEKMSAGLAIIEFATTDAVSGIDHYEVAIIPTSSAVGEQPFFVEARSPYITQPLSNGKYDVIVRAYDNAGNFTDATVRVVVASSFMRFTSKDGLIFGDRFVVPWWTILLFLLLLLILVSFVVILTYRKHQKADALLRAKKLPMATEASVVALDETKKKYVAITQLVFLFFVGFHASLWNPVPVHADELPVSPPIMTTVSRHIGNDEIFYVGGAAYRADATIVLYLQDDRTGAVITEEFSPDKRGEWFYRHDALLSPGTYTVWTQMKVGPAVSPPSPQEKIVVDRTAFALGSSRFSFEFLYLASTLFLLVVVAVLLLVIIHLEMRIRKKRTLWVKEVREAEESVRRGFAVLKRDIEAELAVIQKARLSKDLQQEEIAREKELFKDLASVERYIEKEVFDIEKVGA